MTAWVPPCVWFPTLAGGCQVMMLRLAEGLRLPLGPDDFADYARAMEAARFLVAPEERQSVRGGRRKWVRNRPADETRNEHATVRSLRRLDCWKPFPVWHVGGMPHSRDSIVMSPQYGQIWACQRRANVGGPVSRPRARRGSRSTQA